MIGSQVKNVYRVISFGAVATFDKFHNFSRSAKLRPVHYLLHNRSGLPAHAQRWLRADKERPTKAVKARLN
ncbi:hypothetical protein EVAR_21116_1 [Eumeta japonica]|uniref:Uncharacterized protein n=1 Tax=Eumeta variegata TaxID=151549 RepID=A0A4C1VUR7_EUMVA|nr:hypothetical protein EVAR_21116_1 [Eumeta japonica]